MRMVFSPPSWCIMSHFDFHNHPEDSDELAHWATSCGHFDEVDSGYTVTITDLQKIARKSFQLTFKCLLSRRRRKWHLQASISEHQDPSNARF